MDLILWRHAEAHEARAGEDDLLRPLTARGERQAARMAEWLNRFLPDTTRVLVSPAQRTRQTAAALGRKARSSDDLGPLASPTQALAAARWPDSREAVLLVGHQPALGQLAAYLLGGGAGSGLGMAGAAPSRHDGVSTDAITDAITAMPSWAMRKGAVWWLRRRLRQGEAEVQLAAVMSPDRL